MSCQLQSDSLGQMENIVIERQILQEGSMNTKEFKKTSPPVQSSKTSPLSARLLSIGKKLKDPVSKWMRVELIKLHASGNAMRGSEILSIVEESLEGGSAGQSTAGICGKLPGGPRENTIHLLALHLTPLAESSVRRPLGADGGIDIIIENFSAEPKSSSPTHLVVSASDCVYHLFPERDVLKWAQKIESELCSSFRQSIMLKDGTGPICMATRSTSSCSSRTGSKPAVVAFARKTNKVKMPALRPRSDAITDLPDTEVPSAKPEQETTESRTESHLGKAFVARNPPINSEILTTERHVPKSRCCGTLPNLKHPASDCLVRREGPQFADARHTGAAGSYAAAQRFSTGSMGGATSPITPIGLHSRTLYQLAQAVEMNPQLLSDTDREYRLDGIAVALNIEKGRYRREVLDPRIPGHSAMHKALRLVKEKLQTSGESDCTAQLTDALMFAGLCELAEIYQDLSKMEPVESGLSYGMTSLLSPQSSRDNSLLRLNAGTSGCQLHANPRELRPTGGGGGGGDRGSGGGRGSGGCGGKK